MDSENTSKKKSEAVEVEVTDIPESDAVETVEAPAPEPEKKEKVVAPTTPNAVVGKEATDVVYMSKCVFKNSTARKSLTVHHLQRRLAELGYKNAAADKDGWYGDLTLMDVAAYQTSRGFNGEGMMNAETFAAIFEGDHNVTVVID